MRKMYTLLVICCVLAFCSCTSPESPFSVMERIDERVDLPDGVWYSSAAEEWDASYLPASLREIFFGEKAPDFPWVLYLGTSDDAVAEFLYAVCHTENEAEGLAEVLSLRLSFLKESAQEYKSSLKDSEIVRRGKCVIYAATPKNKELLELAG